MNTEFKYKGKEVKTVSCGGGVQIWIDGLLVGVSPKYRFMQDARAMIDGSDHQSESTGNNKE